MWGYGEVCRGVVLGDVEGNMGYVFENVGRGEGNVGGYEDRCGGKVQGVGECIGVGGLK